MLVVGRATPAGASVVVWSSKCTALLSVFYKSKRSVQQLFRPVNCCYLDILGHFEFVTGSSLSSQQKEKEEKQKSMEAFQTRFNAVIVSIWEFAIGSSRSSQQK
ncbi:uncharacterized protein LOC127288603 isoform X2 [Leptopilina boulardi]|uniref:uncharacterized protein LOC127288603 isoform X2 n=1 Tax=Leptopilina boulardi TaxID=63433 RepID=UPI0021F5CDDE|nr:uncharacterized protein LOC127288603 isoform X2 [Leptopilina boulardi]